MHFVLFYHSLYSDWNHGNAHFLRGIVSELLSRGHTVDVYEPQNGWSLTNLLAEHGSDAISAFRQAYPGLGSRTYDPAELEPAGLLDGADVVIVHEWTDPEVVRRIGAHHKATRGYTLLLHDTHHRCATAPEEMARFDLSGYDAVLAFGRVIRDLYLQRGWAKAAFTWHEAADVRIFQPRPEIPRRGDLVWIGNWGDGERTAEIEEFLLGPAAALGLRTAVYGVRYPEAARRRLTEAAIHYGGWLPNYRVPEAFASHRVTIHIPRRPYAERLPGIPTIRVFEALACAIPLVCAPWRDEEGLFQPGEDYLVARDGQEMRVQLRRLLDDPERARAMAAHGRATVLARHTCAQRVAELLTICDRLRPEQRRPSSRAPAARPAAAVGPARDRLRIAFFGSSLVSAYWNGAATYYRGLIRELHARGHRITFYEPDAFERQKHRDIPDPPYARSVVYEPTAESARAMLRQAGEADIVIKASGVGVLDQLLEAAVVELRGPARRVIFWDVDAPATLERVQSHPDDPFGPLIRAYDYILTYGGGPPVVRAYEALGARRCVPVYNALDPTTHNPAPPDPRFAASLSFLGNRLPDREARVREFFFEAARRLPTLTFLLGGSGWEGNLPDLPNVRYAGHVYTRDHNAFNCTPRAVLNINRESMARFGFSPATRVFEAAGAAACVITDAWEGLELFLTPGRECLAARSGAEVAGHLRELTSEQARQIGQAGAARVLAEHTYARRAAQVEKLLCGNPR